MTPLASTDAPSQTARDLPLSTGNRLRAILIGSAGNLVEWYDFYAYTAFALYFAPSFFPGTDRVVQQLNAAVLFAAGFLVRPVGGWLFGHLADRRGRRNALMLSVLMMSFGSLMIAVTPTYAAIGAAAPALIGLARIVQGLSLGGEYGASATYLAEVADERHRGLYSSLQAVTTIAGQLIAIVILILLQQLLLTPTQLAAWGWRIPFAIGAALSLIVAVMRRTLHETEAFVRVEQIARHRRPLAELTRYRREVLIVVGLTMGGVTAFYTYTTYMQKFLTLSVGLSESRATLISGATLVFALCLQPLYGAISDRVGRKTLLIWFGVMGTLFTIPLLNALQATTSALAAFLLIAAAWIIVAGYTSINALVKAELFPTTVRATGVALPFAVTGAIFGGTTESIALWFKSIGHENWFSYYLTSVIAVSCVVAIFMRDTKYTSAIDDPYREQLP
jgi:MHS family alpha-ketoglutarate permease-like MFS transporter